ncbi:hypothetical protein BH11PSE3_BH11PSE3_21990 [soil metagenome]
MSQLEVERFCHDVRNDTALLAAVAKADGLDAIVSVAARRRYTFTSEELVTFVRARAETNGRELSQADLDAVCGGQGPWNDKQRQEALVWLLHGQQPPAQLPR